MLGECLDVQTTVSSVRHEEHQEASKAQALAYLGRLLALDPKLKCHAELRTAFCLLRAELREAPLNRNQYGASDRRRLADQTTFVALARIRGCAEVKAGLGAGQADLASEALCRRLEGLLPGLRTGRVGAGCVEFSFEATDEGEASVLLASLRPAIDTPLQGGVAVLSRGVGIGVTSSAAGLSKAKLVQQAEVALQASERAGSPHAFFSETERLGAVGRRGLMRDLRQAIACNALTLAYQPKYNLRTETVDAVEGLVRWVHPVRGNVAPDDFISLSEDSGDIDPLTRSVMRSALRDAERLMDAGCELSVHVNLSAVLLADAEFCHWALALCAQSPATLGFEITETALITDPDRALRHLSAFAAAGIAVAIDDYGSGLSSLAYLKLLPAQELKLDKQFVTGLTASHRDPLIVRSTIELAHALGMEVTAEGVDDATALSLLRAMGCDRVQGYYVARPLSFDALLSFLSSPHLHPRPQSATRFGPLRGRALSSRTL